MKNIVCWLLFCGLVAVINAAPKPDKAFWEKVFKGVETRIALCVVDDERVPVPGVNVHAVFSRVEKYDEKDSITDRNGICVVENLTCGNSIVVHLSKDGYYDSTIKLCFIRIGNVYEVRDGKWQPYPMEKTVVLRKIKNSISLTMCGGRYEIPGTNQWYSFDFVKGDWMIPYGEGDVADCEIYYEWIGREPLECERQNFKMRFLNSEFNGYCLVDKIQESAFPYAYRADAFTAYDKDFSDDNFGTGTRDCVLNGNKDVVFRIRCETNSVGKIVSCYYGRFKKMNYYLRRDGTVGLLMRYEYNPVSSDLNLESK